MTGGCVVKGCQRPLRARGYCGLHYMRVIRHGHPQEAVEALERLLGYTRGGDRSWVVRAACRDLGPALFYPERGESTAPMRQVCDACPVRGECLAYALDAGEKHGFWGGESERSRRRLRRTWPRQMEEAS